MTLLYVVLLMIGIGIVSFFMWQHFKLRASHAKKSHLPPFVRVDQEQFDEDVTVLENNEKTSTPVEKKFPEISVPSEHEQLVVFFVLASPDKKFIGYDLLQSILAAGLRFGQMKIFHRHEKLSGEGKILFSMASATNPGTFDVNNMGAFSCTGLCLFMKMLDVVDPVAVFELMLKTATQLSNDLGGGLYDDKRQLLTTERLEACKQRVIDFIEKNKDIFYSCRSS